MSRNVDAIIIDLGKTLMYIPEAYDLEQCIAQEMGTTKQTIVNLVYDICSNYLCLSSDEFTDKLCETLNVAGDAAIDVRLRRICADSIEQAKLQPDVLEALAKLREEGYTLALISNTSPLSKKRIERLGLATCFDHIFFSCDTGYLKPDPRIFLRAIQEMKTTPERTCIVGDRIRTIVLGGVILRAKLVLVERRVQNSIMSDQIPIDAIVPNLGELVRLPLL